MVSRKWITWKCSSTLFVVIYITGIAILLLWPTSAPPMYRPQSSLSPMAAQLQRTLAMRSRVLFYNRVPKCASYSLIVLFSLFHSQFKAIPKMHRSTVNNSNAYRNLPPYWQKKKVVEYLESQEKPLVYEQHVRFIDFDLFESKPFPFYINIIREPMVRIASEYKYHKKEKSKKEKFQWPQNESFIPLMHTIFGRNFEYFCGHHDYCGENSLRALQKAKDNVEKHFLLVGLTENFNEFVEVLAFLVPQYFRKLYNFQVMTNIHVNKIQRPGGFSPELTKLIRNDLENDIIFYEWISERFNNLSKLMRVCKAAGLDDIGTVLYSRNQSLILQFLKYLPSDTKYSNSNW